MGSAADDENGGDADPPPVSHACQHGRIFSGRAANVYEPIGSTSGRRFKWLHRVCSATDLAADLREDAKALIERAQEARSLGASVTPSWQALLDADQRQHPNEKVLVFSQFADTVDYLAGTIEGSKCPKVPRRCHRRDGDPQLSLQIQPGQQRKTRKDLPAKELRVVLATDVLSEGQNLQDCAIVVNYDLPWAIIRLIQRAGRVDRIGQKSDTILCYSFLPADGVERIIRLRSRVRQRLQENAEVVGADETFFEDQDDSQAIRDLFTEKAGILDGEEDTEVDLASYAYQIWKNAIDRNPELEKTIPAMPNVVYSTRPHKPTIDQPEGVLVYLRTAEGNDALAWIDEKGSSVTESQFTILKDRRVRTRHPGAAAP